MIITKKERAFMSKYNLDKVMCSSCKLVFYIKHKDRIYYCPKCNENIAF